MLLVLVKMVVMVVASKHSTRLLLPGTIGSFLLFRLFLFLTYCIGMAKYSSANTGSVQMLLRPNHYHYHHQQQQQPPPPHRHHLLTAIKSNSSSSTLSPTIATTPLPCEKPARVHLIGSKYFGALIGLEFGANSNDVPYIKTNWGHTISSH